MVKCEAMRNLKLLLVFFLCGFFFFFCAKPAYAQASSCVQLGFSCKPICNASSETSTTDSCAGVGQGFVCCRPRTLIDNCGVCPLANGCICPATCVNQIANQSGSCGGDKPPAQNPDTCTPNGFTCRTACQAGETPLLNSCGNTLKCCAPPRNPGNPNPGGNPPAPGAFSSLFGTVTPPTGVDTYNNGAPANIGLIKFISRIIQVATVIAGIIVFVNFILAGFMFISSDGNASVNEKVRNQITMSVIGLVLIVASYTIIAILSLLLFGKADYILSPTF